MNNPTPSPPSDSAAQRTARILVVDDDEDLCLLIEFVLGRAGMDVIRSVEGAEALRLLDREPFDAVVLDIMLPGMDGWDLLEELKRRKVPVVILSVLNDSASSRRGLLSGATAYIPKPFQPMDLVKQVQAALRQ